jgi:ectoine hydroxylase
MKDIDPYWSRQQDQWEIIDRQDPVAWAGIPGPLSDDELARFRERGFVVKSSLLTSREVEELLDEADRLARDPSGRVGEGLITEPDSDAIRSIFRIHRTSEVFGALAADERLVGMARQIVGSEVYTHQSRINFKPGFDGREFYWHSDFETWHIEDGMPRMRAISASVLLTENTPINGPLMLVPGSHRKYVRCVGETPVEHYKQSLKSQRYGVPAPQALSQLVDDGGIVQATGPAGTVVFFECNVMHGSTGNLSPFPRHNIFLVFNSVENRMVEPFGGLPPRPEFLAERTSMSPLPRAEGRTDSLLSGYGPSGHGLSGHGLSGYEST